MIPLLLVLTVVCGVMLVIGFAWALVERGTTTRRSGPQIGAEIASEHMARDSALEAKVPIVRKAWFRGVGVAVGREAEYSYAEIAQQLRRGNLRPVLPALLAMAGMVGMTFFLGLALLLMVSNKVFGVVLLAFSLYAAYLAISGMIRSS